MSVMSGAGLSCGVSKVTVTGSAMQMLPLEQITVDWIIPNSTPWFLDVSWTLSPLIYTT
jgi:hypothetical protein